MADLSGLSTNFFATPKEGFTTTLASTISSGAVTVPLNSVTGYTNGAVITLVVDPTDSLKKQAFTGIVDTSGVQVTSVVWTEGTNQTHTTGSTVVDYVTATHMAALVKGLLASGINQAGTMTPKVAASINDTNGNEVIKIPATASATNEITVTNAANGGAPKISASGSSDANVNLNLQGKGTGSLQINGTDILQVDYVVSGCVWTADAVGSTRLASMTSGVVVIAGNPLTVAAVTSRTFTASKDVYVDFSDNGDGTALITYTDNTTNAASPALTGLRNGIVVVGASNIATTASINQGQEDRVLPIASSIPYCVTDSLGNLICNRNPQNTMIGYRQVLTSFSTTTTPGLVDVTGLVVPVIVPSGRKIKVTVAGGAILTSGGAGTLLGVYARESGTTIQTFGYNTSGVSSQVGPTCEKIITPTAGLHTYNASISQNAAGTMQYFSAATQTAYIKVELV